eukprot:g19849.t1
MLGPQLFTTYINDLGEGTKRNISKIADDTKLGGRVNCGEDSGSFSMIWTGWSLKVSMQVQQAVKKAKGMLAFIARGFQYRSRVVLLQLYRAL